MSDPIHAALVGFATEINTLEDQRLSLGGQWERRATLIALGLGFLVTSVIVDLRKPPVVDRGDERERYDDV